MRFTMTTPCDNCPFRRHGFIPLRGERVREIAGGLLEGNTTFPCHKTVEWSEDTDADGDEYETNLREQQHCAGAFIFCEKQNRPTQMMQISERLREYNRRALKNKSAIFDNLTQMLAAHRAKMRPPRKALR